MEFKITSFEVKNIGDNHWQAVSEKKVLDKLAQNFDPITPIITKMLQGNEIVAESEIYRIRL
jgi:hypothetical protein